MHNSVFVIILLFLIIIIISTTTTTTAIIISVVTGFSYLLLLLNQRRSPPLRLQVSDCSTFCITCNVPSIAVFCSESTECFPGMAPKFFFKPFVIIPVAPVITWIAYISCSTFIVSLYIYSYFSPFLLPFVWHFSVLVLPYLSVCVLFSLFGFNY